MNSVAIRQANNDEQMIELWVREQADNTARYYETDVHEFLLFTGKSIQEVTLNDIQVYEDELEQRSSTVRGKGGVRVETGNPLSQGTKARKINAIKSLLT